MVRPDRDLPFFPALCYILLLAALFCWAFSSVAFFLDRYRVPVLVPLALLFGRHFCHAVVGLPLSCRRDSAFLLRGGGADYR